MTTTARITIVQAGFRDEPALRVPVDVPVALFEGNTPEDIAEACFAAVDMPQLHSNDATLAGAIATAVLPRREIAQVGDMRGFMVGDFVEFGDTRLRCDSVGWSPA